MAQSTKPYQCTGHILFKQYTLFYHQTYRWHILPPSQKGFRMSSISPARYRWIIYHTDQHPNVAGKKKTWHLQMDPWKSIFTYWKPCFLGGIHVGFQGCTPLKINIEPENHLFDKGSHLNQTFSFGGSTVGFRWCKSYCWWKTSPTTTVWMVLKPRKNLANDGDIYHINRWVSGFLVATNSMSPLKKISIP